MSEIQESNPDASDTKTPRRHDTPTVDDNKSKRPREVGGRKGPEPTRFGDWEKAGRCIDF
ncbi:MAG: succinate dehydrogenase assembly factor 4 [Woeseia sp.]